MADDQRDARLLGFLFLLTSATSIPAVLLFHPVLYDPAGYVAGAGLRLGVRVGPKVVGHVGAP